MEGLPSGTTVGLGEPQAETEGMETHPIPRPEAVWAGSIEIPGWEGKIELSRGSGGFLPAGCQHLD